MHVLKLRHKHGISYASPVKLNTYHDTIPDICFKWKARLLCVGCAKIQVFGKEVIYMI